MIRSRALTFALVTALGVGAPAALAKDLTLEEVQIHGGETTEVVLVLDEPSDGSLVSTFEMSDPPRLVVDVVDAVVARRMHTGDPAGLVRSVEAKSWDDGQGMMSRITLTLTGPVDHRVTSEGERIRVQISSRSAADDPLAAALAGGDEARASSATAGGGEDALALALEQASGIETTQGTRPLSGPENIASTRALSSLDFQNLDQVSRVVVGLAGTQEYSVSQPQNNLIVVDVPGAFLPQSLQRVLDASAFLSPVRMVRAYRTGSGARVAISLRTPTSYTARLLQGNLLYVDVAIPPGLQQDRQVAEQAFSAVSPTQPDDGIKSAYQQEIMIGQSGRTVDPQAAFGSGGGSADPSALLGMASGFMYDTTSAASTPYAGRRISLDFVNADIHSIFRLISHVSRLNIVAGDDVQGKVTVRMVDVPWDQALAAVLQAKGLGSQRFGNIVRVAPIETIKAEQQSALEAKRAEEELTDLDMLVLPLNYTQASELKDKVQELLSSRGTVQVDETGNQLIIKETAERLAQIRELIRHLDKQTPQVLIEARIVEAGSNFSRAMGIQWGAEVDATTRTGASTGLFFPNGVGLSGGLTTAGAESFYTSDLGDSLMVDLGADASTSSLALSLGSISGILDLDARLSALETDGYGKVVSSPRITTLDNKTAKIAQGARIPYLSTSAGGTNVQFVKAALELEVTPHITSDNKVFLNVAVKNDRADFSQLVQGQPAILQKEAETELLVSNGDTTVLGGVFSSSESYTYDKVPFFHKIPILGYLFKSSDEEVTREELLVFITPHIVSKPIADGG